jgi:pilus assembly protein FimV
MPLKMSLITRPKSLSLSLKTLSASVACAVLMFSNAQAAGLGKLTVLSALGQPLRAEIELNSVTPEEAGSLVAKLASPDAFRQVNIDFNPALLSLRFAIEQRGSRQIIKVSSQQPINDPFVDMLLELNSNGGRLVREYTFLLDPAELRTTQPAQVSTPSDVPVLGKSPTGNEAVDLAETQTTRTSRNGKPSKTKPAPVPKPENRIEPDTKAAENNSGGTRYQVKKGDTLGQIAGQLRGSGVSLDQMLVALYRANEAAFIDKNMNRLRSGQILQIPDAENIRAIAQADARGVVLAHAADFNAYRNKLAGQIASQ